MATTGNFQSTELLAHEERAIVEQLGNQEAIEIGQLATKIGLERKLPIAIQVQIGEWVEIGRAHV